MDHQVYEIATAGEIADGQMKEVQAGDRKLVLANIRGDFYAVSGECPHYGAPLAEGVLCGTRLLCPWHKAVFDITNGTLLEPPALDALESYPTTLRDGKIFVELKEHTKSAANTPSDHRCFVIAGAGGAATAAAQELRELGFTGRLVMFDGEKEAPYDRPKLSKEFLTGKADEDELPLRPLDFWQALQIERVRQTVTALNAPKKVLTLSDGSIQSFDAALLATGSEPNPLEIAGAQLKNVFLLRSHADATAINEAAKTAKRAVVIGGSFIAMEAAASLAARKLEVTVVVSKSRPFERSLGPEVGAILQKLHEENGVGFELKAEVDRLEDKKGHTGVVLKSGKTLPADLVVVGVGVKPVVDYAGSLARSEDGGIEVDKFLAASDGVYVAGDAASFPEFYSQETARIEHWRVALQQGRTAAANMLGQQRPFLGVPFFWTVHFDTQIDYVGHTSGWDNVILDHDGSQFPKFLAYYIKRDRLVAAAGCQRDADIIAIHELMRLNRLPSANEIRTGVDFGKRLAAC